VGSATLRGSGWPLRMVGDPRWYESVVRGWNHACVNSPHDVIGTFYRDLRISAWLYRLVRSARPSLVVETGVHRGKSSVAILAALRANGRGRLVSIDLPRRVPWVNADGKWEGTTVAVGDTGCLVPSAWRDRWTLLLGDARSLLPEAVRGGVDLFFHDSEHSFDQMTFEYSTAWAELSVGGILATDDVNWSEAWPTFLWRTAGWERMPDGPCYHRSVRRVG